MKFYGLKTCDTCRKALKALRAAGHDPQIIDVRADGLSFTEIDAVVQHFAERALNKSSATWRGLSDAERDMSVSDLLAAHPTVMKRPVIAQQDQWTLGWTADVQSEWIG